jgi:hypothetical protein
LASICASSSLVVVVGIGGVPDGLEVLSFGFGELDGDDKDGHRTQEDAEDDEEIPSDAAYKGNATPFSTPCLKLESNLNLLSIRTAP